MVEDRLLFQSTFNDIASPIILVGTTRSGKTLLARCLSYLKTVSWWSEPNTVWKIGAAYRGHDRRLSSDATGKVVTRIHRAYAKQQKAVGGNRIVDDSPLHCLGVPFARAVFPQAKIIHIFRDGRDVICDVLQSWRKRHAYSPSAKTAKFVGSRLRETPLLEWPTYLPRAIEGIYRWLFPNARSWRARGPRYPGWRSDFRSLETLEFISRQWQVCQEYALNDLIDCPPQRCIHIAYEAFVSRPACILAEILDFLGETVDDSLLRDIAKEIATDYVGQWRKLLDKETQGHLLSFLEPTLSRVEKLCCLKGAWID